MDSKVSFATLMPLFMVILLDVAGIILVLPVLTPLILQTDSVIVPIGTSLFVRDFLYGFSLALFPLFMFFSTPILGDLSDKFGRKNILLICLIGSGLSYLVAAIGIVVGSLFTLLVSRAIAGLAAGTQPIAIAAIIDMSTPKTQTKNLAWVVFIASIGIVIGPLVGGLTAEKSIFSWFGYPMPFILAAVVSFINAIVLYFSYQEKILPKLNQAVDLFKGFTLFVAAFREQKFRLVSLLYFCFGLAWSLYYQAITWFFLEKYHYTAHKLGLFIAFLGFIGAAVISVLPRFIMRFFSSDISAYAFFILMMAIANLGAAMSQGELAQWLWVILNASSEVICFTVALNIFSGLANEESQGWVMGVSGSVGAITWTVGGLIAGPLGFLNIYAPLWVAGFLCLISFILTLYYKKNHTNEVI